MNNWLTAEKVDDLVWHVARPYEDLDEKSKEALETLSSEGEYVSYGDYPLDDRKYFEHEGVFYRIQVETEGIQYLDRKVLFAEEVNESSEEAVEPDVYSGSDREVLRDAIRLNSRGDDTSVKRSYGVIRSTENQTELLPKPRHPFIAVGDTTYRVTVGEREVEEQRYVTEGIIVGNGKQEFLEYIEREHVVNFDARGLPEGEQRVLETLTAEGRYEERGMASDRLNSLLPKLREKSEKSRYALFKYDGDYYTWRYGHSD